MSGTSKFLLPALISVGSLISARPASAAADANEAPTQGLEEIIVTAQKRSEDLQKVALAVSAITGEALKATGVFDAQGLTDMVPSLEVGQNNANTTFAIRGISSTTDATLGDAAVAFHLDGVFEGRPAAASGLFYDIQRVEVLRGPQGTLYGRNATAGAINVITNQPTFDGYHAEARIETGNHEEVRTEAMFNAPISETFAVRGAAQTLRHSAYLNSGYDDADDHALRLQALWRPADGVSLLLFGDYFHQGGVGAGYTELTRVTDGFPNYNPIPQRPGPWPSWHTTLPLTTIAGYVSPNGWSDNESWSTHAQLTWDLGPVVLTDIAAYHHLRVDFFAYGNGLDNLQDDRERETSNELRLSSGANSTIKWVAGLFYHNEEQPYQQEFYDNVGPAAFPCFNNAATYLGECTSLHFVYPKISNPSYASFGQLTYPITSDWRVTGGVRWNHDHKRVIGGTYRVFGDENTGGAPTFTSFGNVYPTKTSVLAIATNADVTWTKVTWRAGIEHDVTDNSLAYANVSTGYKQGGVFAGAPPNTYNPETLTAYEIGSKNRFIDNRLQVNADVFYYKYKDYQVDQLENLCVVTRAADGTCPGNSYGFGDDIFNAARATEFGAEVETRTRLSDADEVALNVAYLHAKFDEFQFPLQGDPRNPTGTIQSVSLAGTSPTSAPEFTGTFSYQHTWKTSGGSSLAWMLQTHVESAYWLAVDHNTDPLKEIGSRQRGYTRSQTSVTYSTPEGRFSIQAWVRNIEDKPVMTLFSYGGGGTAPYASISPPRTFGVTVGGRF